MIDVRAGSADSSSIKVGPVSDTRKRSSRETPSVSPSKDDKADNWSIMDTFPLFRPDALTTDEVEGIARRIAADTSINCPLPSTHNASWSSKDLGIGEVRTPPIIKAPQPSGHNDGQSSRKVQAEQFDAEVQRDALEFVGSDVRVELALEKPLRWIRVRGLGRTFYHFQIYAAFWLLIADRGVRRGTILADMMGLGKVGEVPSLTSMRASVTGILANWLTVDVDYYRLLVHHIQLRPRGDDVSSAKTPRPASSR